MFFCCTDTTIQTDQLESTTYYEFTRTHPQTRQKYVQSVPYNPKDTYAQFQGWQRTKVKLLNYNGLIQNIKARGMTNYFDEDFPQTSSSIGKNFERAITWLRIKDLVKDPIYISETTLQEWNRFRCSNKSLQSAMYLLRKHSPQIFKNLMSKTLVNEGVYQFRAMVDGVITNLIIDDYVPSTEGMAVYSKPYKFREVFPLLIEKVLAKAFGSYLKIPDNPLPLVQVLGCTTILTWPLSIKVSNDQLLALKSRIDVESSSNCFIPRRGLERMEHGLLQDEPYMIMAVHEVLYNNKPIVLYQVINLENKGDWNGPFSYFDKNWNNVVPNQAKTLKARTQANDSMMIEETDVLKYFSLMGSIQKTQECSQDWTTITINKHHALYFTINITSANEKIYIKTWAVEAARQVLILARILTEDRLEFIDGSMVEQSKNIFIRSAVPIGVYVLFIKVEWKTRENAELNLNVLSKLPVQLIEANKLQYPNFLPRLFTYLIWGPSQVQPQIKNKDYSVYILYRKTGYACIVLKPQNSNINRFIIDEKLLLQSGYKLRKPHAGKGAIFASQTGVQMLTLKVTNNQTLGDSISFPQSTIKVLPKI